MRGVKIQIEDGDKAKIVAAAKTMGLTMAAFIRSAALEKAAFISGRVAGE